MQAVPEKLKRDSHEQANVHSVLVSYTAEGRACAHWRIQPPIWGEATWRRGHARAPAPKTKNFTDPVRYFLGREETHLKTMFDFGIHARSLTTCGELMVLSESPIYVL